MLLYDWLAQEPGIVSRTAVTVMPYSISFRMAFLIGGAIDSRERRQVTQYEPLKQGKGMLDLLLNGGWTQRMIRGYTVNLL
jgi:hypothetical protein